MMEVRVDLDGLDAFVAVVERGSFTAAARAAGVAPSAISRRVARLEAALGVRLLARTSRRVGLTEAGRELWERAAGPLRALADAADELRAADAAIQGRVRVAVPGALGRRRIAPLLFRLGAVHPGLQLDLRVSDATVELVGEAVDIAVRVGPPREGSHAVRVLGHSPQVFAASPGYLAVAGAPCSLAELRSHRCLLRREGGRLLAPPGLDLVPAFVSDDVETVARAACAGLGVALLPAWLVADLPGLVVLGLAAPVPPAPVVAVLPGGRRPPRRVRAVLDALAAGLGAGLGPAAGEEGGVAGETLVSPAPS
jgi:DNA-binding transcriptional LysR family regulator